MVELKGYKINSIEFDNKVANGTELKLQNQVKYNVNYIDADKRCVGILNFKVADAEMNPFEIKIEMVAEFSYEEGDERPDIHTASFDQIFPFLRQAINGLTSMAGMPPLMIPIMKLKRESVEMNSREQKKDDEGMLN